MFLVLVLSLLLAVAGSLSDATTQVALAIAAAVSLFSPLLLRYVPLDGKTMLLVSYGLALLIAIIAAAVTGQIKAIDTSSVLTVLATSTFLWSIQQAVYNVLKDQPPKTALAMKGFTPTKL